MRNLSGYWSWQKPLVPCPLAAQHFRFRLWYRPSHGCEISRGRRVMTSEIRHSWHENTGRWSPSDDDIRSWTHPESKLGGRLRQRRLWQSLHWVVKKDEPLRTSSPCANRGQYETRTNTSTTIQPPISVLRIPKSPEDSRQTTKLLHHGHE